MLCKYLPCGCTCTACPENISPVVLPVRPVPAVCAHVRGDAAALRELPVADRAMERLLSAELQ